VRSDHREPKAKRDPELTPVADPDLEVQSFLLGEELLAQGNASSH